MIAYVKETIHSFYDSIINTILSLFKRIVHLCIILGAFSITSVLVTLFIGWYIMSIPNIIENSLSLSLSNNNQVSTLYFNCTKQKDTCSNIEPIQYQVLFEYELVKNEKSVNTGNFEVELNYLFNDELKTEKRINFLEVNDFYIETFHKIVNFPLNILGYKKTEIITMKMINELDNRKLGLDYLEVIVKNNQINIKNPKIVFIPVVGFLKSLVWQFRAVTLPVLFFSIIFIQVSVFLLIKILVFVYEKVLSR